MTDVFISYARSSQPQAQLIDDALTSLGYSVWRDPELPLHRPYTRVIEERLRDAKAVVVVWSKEAVGSDWVRAEADVAREADKLVQVSIDGVLPPIPFNQIQCGDLAGWAGEADARPWRRLLASLSELATPAATIPAASGATVAPAAASTSPLLAVLPFDNLSGDADLLYFSDGVSEEILQTVVQTTSLKVVGRSSSFQFRGPEKKAARRVAAELGCTHLLDGSVRRSGARVRISATLIECAGQTTVWSDRFDRDLTDVFALQDDIAAAVANALKSTFAPSAGAKPVDPIAYDLYLRARASTPGAHGAFDADLLRQATQRQPDFAQAWAALAITRAVHFKTGDGKHLDDARREATEAAGKALGLDPNSGKAYVALALLEPVCGRFEAAEAFFERALAAGPDDVDVLEKYSRWLHGVGRTEAALAHVTHAFRIDPLFHQGANWYAVLIANRGRLAEAFEVWDRARARWPAFDILVVNPINVAALSGDRTRVDTLVAYARDHHMDSIVMRDAIAFAEGRTHPQPQSKQAILASLRAQVRDTGTLSLNRLAFAYAPGLADELFSLVEQASFRHLFEPGGRLAPGDYGLHVLFNGAQPMRADPRFVRLCAKLGLCHYWANTGRWPDYADATPYDFRAEARRLAEA